MCVVLILPNNNDDSGGSPSGDSAGTPSGDSSGATPTTTTNAGVASQGSATTTATDRTAPTLTRLRTSYRAGKASARFSVSEAAKARLTLQRHKGGRWVTVKTFIISAKAGANKAIIKLRAGKGRYRLAAVATDAAGNRGATVRSSFTIPRR